MRKIIAVDLIDTTSRRVYLGPVDSIEHARKVMSLRDDWYAWSLLDLHEPDAIIEPLTDPGQGEHNHGA